MASISDLLAKGLALTADDLIEIETKFALMPLDDVHEQRPWVMEALSLIVNDPDYKGDIPPFR